MPDPPFLRSEPRFLWLAEVGPGAEVVVILPLRHPRHLVDEPALRDGYWAFTTAGPPVVGAPTMVCDHLPRP